MAEHDTDPMDLVSSQQLVRAMRPHLARSVGSHSLIGLLVYGLAWYLMHQQQPLPANCASKDDLARIEEKLVRMKEDMTNLNQATNKDLERTRNELLIAIAGLKSGH